MSKRLLIAVDGSPAANAALLEAIEMARAGDSDLRLVHIIDETSVPWTDGGIERRARSLDALAAAGDKVLADGLAMIRAAGLGASCTRLRRDRTVDTVSALIASEAKSWAADMIVIGTLGRGPISRVLRGSVDAAVMRNCAVPVLPVKPRVAHSRRLAANRHPIEMA